MHSEKIKPTKFLIISIITSSVLIFIAGISALILGTGYEKLIASCLTIPIFSAYIFLGQTCKQKIYWANNLHWIFWWISSSIAWSIGLKIPFLMLFLFTVILYKRKKNFIKINCVGYNQAF